MGFSIWHLLVFLIVVFLVFGTKKIRNVGSDLGHAIKGFRDAMKDGGSQKETDDDSAHEKQSPHPAQGQVTSGRIIDAESHREENPTSSHLNVNKEKV